MRWGQTRKFSVVKPVVLINDTTLKSDSRKPFAERDDPDGQEYEEKVEAEFFVAQGLTPATLEDEEIE